MTTPTAQTTTTLAALIGELAMLQIESLEVAVNIVDAKQAYGHTRVLVEPVNGSGKQWVDLSRVKLDA